MIGTGSFGSVYKGVLDDNNIVAVKVLNLQNHKAIKSFDAECTALRNIRHRNLVKVITVCSSIDFQGNDFRALVYEFMANGSLDTWLHLSRGSVEDEHLPKRLNFLQRLNIATDVACALDYLHHDSDPTIVHCDLKPSNILLDDDMVGHVGDFGLARFLVAKEQSFITQQSSSIGVKGTIGYMAPGEVSCTFLLLRFIYKQIINIWCTFFVMIMNV